MDQPGAIVDGNHPHTRRQSGLDLPEPLLDPADHLQRVAPLAHHHDSGYRLPGPVQIRNSAARLRPQRHLSHIPDAHGPLAVLARKHDLFNVADAAGVAATANHIFGTRELDEPAARLDVARLHRFHNAHHRNAKSPQPVWVQVHLELAFEAAHGGHFGDSRNAAQMVAEVPILDGAQLSQAVPAAGVTHHVLQHPAKSGGVRADLGFGARRQFGSTWERYSRVRDRAQYGSLPSSKMTYTKEEPKSEIPRTVRTFGAPTSADTIG